MGYKPPPADPTRSEEVAEKSKKKRKVIFQYTRCWDCKIRLMVDDNSHPDDVIEKHRHSGKCKK